MTRLKLDELQVRSFVTKLTDHAKATAEGGGTIVVCSVDVCRSDQWCGPGTRTCDDGSTGLNQCDHSIDFGCTHNGCSLTCSYAISDCC